ncbi:hypothetical protein MNBD_BACTEROID05-267 [hydrothermal vent metagenome]|uniref:MYG1 protein n=1 Tax=hydrothermal vent metagenome TaxID=652676 RepID=A0A3B0TAW4_9ZZZZ
MEDKKVKIITHSGNFHTDDVFAVSVLVLLLNKRNEEYEIIRTRDPEVMKTGDFIVDVGGEYDQHNNRFDHHQKGGAGERENGISYSSFGLIWEKYGEELCGSVQAKNVIDKRFGYPVDSADNGINTFNQVRADIFPYIIHNITMVFRPTWKEEEEGTKDYMTAFMDYLPVARNILEREIVHAKDEIEGGKLVVDAYKKTEDKRIVTIDGHYPWEDVLNNYPEPLYVVKPDHQNGGAWKVKAVRDIAVGFENRKDLPEEWAGRRGEELAEITGVPDAIFCHNKRWIAVAGSKEGALALAKLAVENNN